jgi:hypothetical protein
MDNALIFFFLVCAGLMFLAVTSYNPDLIILKKSDINIADLNFDWTSLNLALPWQDENVADNITVDWVGLQNYPKPCDQGEFVSQIDDTLTCSVPQGTTIDTNTQTACDDNLVMLGDGSCVSYTVSQTYLPTSIKTVYGTDFNNASLPAILAYDLNYYTVREANGGNPLQVDINFTGITKVDSISMRERYEGGQGHEIIVEVWDYAKSVWESYFVITDQAGAVVTNIPIYDSTDHISGGLVQLRFRHTGNGIISHYLFLDFVWLQKGTTTLVNAEHDSLGGRDDPENHPWAVAYVDFDSGTGGALIVGAKIGNDCATICTSHGLDCNQSVTLIGSVGACNLTVEDYSCWCT